MVRLRRHAHRERYFHVLDLLKLLPYLIRGQTTAFYLDHEADLLRLLQTQLELKCRAVDVLDLDSEVERLLASHLGHELVLLTRLGLQRNLAIFLEDLAQLQLAIEQNFLVLLDAGPHLHVMLVSGLVHR